MREMKSYAEIKAPRKVKPRKRIKKSARTKGGRNSNPTKLAWLRTQPCLVAAIVTHDPHQRFVCWGVTEVHHDRKRGARATDAKTLPLCTAHHRTGPNSVQTLGRQGFEDYLGTPLDGEIAWYEAEFARSRRSSETPK